ncbi:MAG: YgiQ family radical SAM protein [Bacteroidales bacterium]|nr:YgiQ family radical SAM protein [Bacteroidales bacterium]
MGFLPVNKKEMLNRGWERPDFVYVIGDAYVDHPSFGHAIISRVLEANGYKVAIISQPDWRHEESITEFGEPRLGFLVTAGNMDSMVNHYTVSKKKRKEDAYTPGGEMGKRPDYATIVYCNLIKRVYKHSPVIIGGIEASLRRMAHYDYWSGKLKRSVLLDSGADLLLYGMGEHAVVEVADALNSGLSISDITFVNGTVYKTKDAASVYEGIMLPEFAAMQENKLEYAKSFNIQYRNTDSYVAKPLIEKYGEKRYIVQNPPSRPLTMQEMDDIYELPYMRNYHPSYEDKGGVPAISEIKFSLTSNRGCFGGCSFCALTFHQGRTVQCRSHESLIREAVLMTKEPDFKGYIHDVGGPTANFRAPSCEKQLTKGVCPEKQCLFPEPCRNLNADHTDYIKLLRRLREIPGVKKVFIRSGIRFDYVLADKQDTFLRELCQYHISGQLRVAPEHVADSVLSLMGKPGNAVYKQFTEKFYRVNEMLHKEQYLVPYLMSSHPGSGLKEAVILAEHIRELGYMPEQVQDFYPTPSTISTCMYYTGVDPRTMKKVYIPSHPHEKAMQRALIQYRRPENYDLVKEALLKAGRQDLIGFDKKCLIPPRKMKSAEGKEERQKENDRQNRRRKPEKRGGKRKNKRD